MAPTNTLACLALLVGGLGSNVVAGTAPTKGVRAAQRNLQADETIITEVESDGSTYSVGVFDGDTTTSEVIAKEPDDTEIHAHVGEDGKVTSIVVNGVEHVIEYDGDDFVGESVTTPADRRTQEAFYDGGAIRGRQLQLSCENQCYFDLGFTCGALDQACRIDSLALLLGTVCSNLDLLCGEDAIVAGCTEFCATPAPTMAPTPAPTMAPSPAPTNAPSPAPTNAPSPAPTNAPSPAPTNAPSPAPVTPAPTKAPTMAPTPAPTMAPSPAPTNAPTPAPVTAATPSPTEAPTMAPSPAPTNAPSPAPVTAATPSPTEAPTMAPSPAPTNAPSPAPVVSQNCELDDEGTLDLENLDLVDANIGDIKACLLDLSNNGEEVVEIDLGKNKLEVLPADLFENALSVQIIRLDKNNIQALPVGIFQGLSALTYLNLDVNMLNDAGMVVGVFGGLTSLERLSLEENILTTLPLGIFSDFTSTVEEVELDENDLKSLPIGLIEELTALEKLDLTENVNLECLPRVCAECDFNDIIRAPDHLDEDDPEDICDAAEGTPAPTMAPTPAPTKAPSPAPVTAATPAPTKAPTTAPTPAPTNAPSPSPVAVATPAPTEAPTMAPTPAPTNAPSPAPVTAATPAPTEAPTMAPTPAPTNAPSAAPVTEEGPTCWNGIPGLQTSNVCCPTSCGTCAGTGCAQRDGGDGFTGKEACCGSEVRKLDRVCSDDVGAPCIFPEGTCQSGIPGIQNSNVCCPTSCGICAGSGCTGRDGGDGFSGKEACCGGGVRGLGRTCSEDVGAPCIYPEE